MTKLGRPYKEPREGVASLITVGVTPDLKRAQEAAARLAKSFRDDLVLSAALGVLQRQIKELANR